MAWLPPRLQGFDLDYALSLLDGNRGLFKRLVLSLGEQFGDVDARMSALLAAGNLGEAASLAHKLKGAAGNLGASRLREAASRIEEIAGAPEQSASGVAIAAAQAALCKALDEVLADVGSLRDAQPLKPAMPEYDCGKCHWQRAGELLQQLRVLVDNYDFVPHELVIELRDSIACQPLRKKIDMIGRHTEATDYASAKAILDEITCREGHDLGTQAKD
jgi:HPt (histidine-containing phosphotransfer) domain-containing protein